MFDMLGREGFKKWVKMQTILEDVKSLVYEWADKEEMLETGRNGSYNRFENKIRIRRDGTSPKTILGVSKHECFHFFTRRGELLSLYLSEGATGYLKHLTEDEKESYSYKENF